MLGQIALGENQIGGLRRAEVGAPIADQDAQRSGFRGQRRAFAVSRGRAAIVASMREAEPPALAAKPFQVVGDDRNIDAGAREHRRHDPVEPVGDHAHLQAEFAAQRHEVREMRIDGGAMQEGVERVRACAHQVDLAREAFARTDAARDPVGLHGLPGRTRETFQDEVGRIAERNGAVEIDENTNPRRDNAARFFPHRTYSPPSLFFVVRFLVP